MSGGSDSKENTDAGFDGLRRPSEGIHRANSWRPDPLAGFEHRRRSVDSLAPTDRESPNPDVKDRSIAKVTPWTLGSRPHPAESLRLNLAIFLGHGVGRDRQSKEKMWPRKTTPAEPWGGPNPALFTPTSRPREAPCDCLGELENRWRTGGLEGSSKGQKKLKILSRTPLGFTMGLKMVPPIALISSPCVLLFSCPKTRRSRPSNATWRSSREDCTESLQTVAIATV
jgi:hypothetical protein